MFYVNNDDMDELFRDAAEKYPLKTEGTADWEKVAGLLRDEAGIPFVDAGAYKKEKKRRVFFWWLLLLPLGWIGHESWQKMHLASIEKKQVSFTEKQVGENKKADEITKNDVAADKIKNTASLSTIDKKETAINKQETSSVAVASQDFKKASTKIEAARSENLISQNSATKHGDKKRNDYNLSLHKQNKSSDNFALADRKTTNPDDQLKDNANLASANKNQNVESKDNLENKDEKNVTEKGNLSTSAKDESQKNTIAKTTDSSEKKESLKTTEAPTEKKAAKTTVKIQPTHHFYIGLMAGADVSTVKFQSVKGVGNTVGLLLGYHFGKSKLSVESGVYWDTKKYYSKGEYFDKSKVPYLNNPNVNLLYVNGNCNMFEIPVNVRYNFLQKKSTSFFAVAGISSYLMSKEAYGYGYEESGWQGYSKQSYYHSTQNWFSILNLSVGLEHHLGKIGDIRVEPYAKLPLSGVGKGSLSLTSAGLNIGLIRKF